MQCSRRDELIGDYSAYPTTPNTTSAIIAVKITARHKADATHPIVAAASIIAKIQRDHAVGTPWVEVEDFGSGYPSDSCGG